MTPQPAIEPPSPAPDTDSVIRTALDGLERQIEVVRVTKDPLLHPLEALAATVRAMRHLFVDGSATLAERSARPASRSAPGSSRTCSARRPGARIVARSNWRGRTLYAPC